MTINLSMPEIRELRPRITVIGVGGAGGNAVNNMIRANLEGVEFVVANTDAQALSQALTERRIQLGVGITHGLGAGSRPDIGRAAAEEAIDPIIEALDGSHMAFITAGMGGGTGTGAAPVIAQAARERGMLTVGVVTKPFQFEGAHRMAIAEAGIEEVQAFVDTLIVIPNQNLFRVANEHTTFADAFNMADDVLHAGVRGVTDLMIMPGLINLDFADVRAVMSEMGKAMMGTGEAEGEKRALEAAEAAISNPLLDDVSMQGARGVLINITGGMDMTLFEVDEAANRIRDEVDADANIIFGSTFDDTLEGRMRVSVVATGIEAEAIAGLRPPVLQTPDLQAKRMREGGSPVTLAAVSGETVSSTSEGAPSEGLGNVSVQAPMAVAGGGTATAAALEPASQADPVETAREPEPPVPAEHRAPPQARHTTAAGDKPFIAPRPMASSSRRSSLGRPEPFAEAAVANSGGSLTEKRSSPGFLERITRGHARRAESEESAEGAGTTETTAERQTPAGAVKEEIKEDPTAPTREDAGKDLIESMPEDDLLDIPAFLRRQTN